MLNHARACTCAFARVHAVREHDKYVAHATWGYSSMCRANLKRIISKMSEDLITRAFTHARFPVRAVREYEKYVAHAT
jgi:hypothetical protein